MFEELISGNEIHIFWGVVPSISSNQFITLFTYICHGKIEYSFSSILNTGYQCDLSPN